MKLILFISFFQIVAVVGIGILIAKFRLWKPKRTLYFIVTYAACGVIAVLYLSVFSNDLVKGQSASEMTKQQQANDAMMERLKARDFTVLTDDYLKFTHAFEPTATDITINREKELRNIATVIEWTESTDNTITASYYETPIYQKRIELSQYIHAPNIRFKDNTIFIEDKESRINMKTLNVSFEMLDANRWNDKTDRFVGNRILYLNVPKHFNIIDDGGWLE